MTPESDADSGVTITGRRNCLPYCLALNRPLCRAMLGRGGCERSCPSVCVGYAWVEEGYTKVWGARWEYRARCCSKRTSPRSAKSFRVMPFSELVRIKESINRAVQNNIRSFLVSLDSAHLAR